MTGLCLEDLTIEIGTQAVVRGAQFSAPRGMVTGLIGPNGAGKSTVLKAIAGIIRPRAGRILLEDVDLAGLTAMQRARKIAYLPQISTEHLDLSVRALAALGRFAFGLSAERAEKDPAVALALRATGLTDLAARRVTTLSGGERSRALLARALAVEADATVADEPVAALDLKAQIETLEALRQRARRGCSVLVVMHDLSLAARFCDQLVLMDNGETRLAGPPESILKADATARAYGVTLETFERDGLSFAVAKL